MVFSCNAIAVYAVMRVSVSVRMYNYAVRVWPTVNA